MKRVVLVKPPERSKLNFGGFSLAVLAAAVKDVATVSVLDATNMSFSQAVNAATSECPDIIGITAMGLPSVDPVRTFIAELRGAGFGGLVVVGGHGASMSPKALLEKGADAIVRGEGEQTLRELILCGATEKVRGLALLKRGATVITPERSLIANLDELPRPDRSLIGPPADGVYLLETSRGCPHSCAFCETASFYHNKWRARSPKLVMEDVVHLVEDEGATIIQITDDNFTANSKRALEICHLLENRPLPLFFIFFARSDDILRCPELTPALAEAHFLRVIIGVETVVPELTKSIHKSITFQQHKQAISALTEGGIFTQASLILGLPGENALMREEYLEAAIELGADSVIFLPFQPLPGTPMARGTGEPERWCIEEAARLNREIDRDPKMLPRLMSAGEQPTVRGMLARASLLRRVKEKALDYDGTARILEWLHNRTFADYSG